MSRIVSVLLAAVSWAIVGGAIEAGTLAFRQYVQNRIIFTTRDYLLFAPAAYAVILMPAALALYLLSVMVRRPLSQPAIHGLLAASVTFGTLICHPVIAWWAVVPLSAGAGVQVMRLTRTGGAVTFLPRAAKLVAGMAVILVAAWVGTRVAQTRSVLPPAAEVPSPPPPNVLLVVLDTVRAKNLSLYGYERPTTPHLERWATESVVFDRALSTAPWTLPTHGSLLTGREPDDLGLDFATPMKGDVRTLAEVLRDRGYATGGFVANFVYAAYDSGLARGFATYDDYRFTLRRLVKHSPLGRINLRNGQPNVRSLTDAWSLLTKSTILDSESPAKTGRDADDVAAAFLGWQQEVKGRPFFAFLNMMEAHSPYKSPPEFQKYGTARDIDKYDASITWLDHTVNGLLETLRQRGVLDNTIVVVTSDHGELFGEHGIFGHANSLYMPVLHVPLLVRYPPSAPKGVRVSATVSVRDVAATILDFAGFGTNELDGSSLASAWRGQAGPGSGVARSMLHAGINFAADAQNAGGGMVGSVDGRLHYARTGNGREELYDYIADPEETRNLAADAAFAADLRRLRAIAERK